MSTYKVKREDLIGDIKDFPIEIVQAMVDEQVRQRHKADVSVFQEECLSGLIWASSVDGADFWRKVILYRDFSLFFEKYPPQPKEVRIQIPEGYEIDKENSTFEKIVFKEKEVAKKIEEKILTYSDLEEIEGYYIDSFSGLCYSDKDFLHHKNRNVFRTRKQAESSLAMAMISQLLPEYCKPFSDEEWGDAKIEKYCIIREKNLLFIKKCNLQYHFLAFRTLFQAEIFLSHNRNLVEVFFMM